MIPNHSDPRRCAAQSKRSKERCRRWAAVGSTVCTKHGAGAPQVRAAAARRMTARAAQKDAAALLAFEGVAGVADPVGALAELAAEARAVKSALARRVNALADVRYTDTKGAEQLRSEVALYERAMDRAGKFLEALARLGYEERRVEMVEALGDSLVTLIEDVLNGLNLTAGQRALVPTVVPRALRAADERERVADRRPVA